MTENVRLQNLRDFTVQIRNANEQIVGTGIAISSSGDVVTCKHVIEEAIKGSEQAIGDAEVEVYFPQALGGEKKDYQAKVAAWFTDYDDDLVILQLNEAKTPLGPERLPTIGTAESSKNNTFNSYGYKRLENYIAGYADGLIQGYVESPPDRKLQVEPVQIKSTQINRGMSGAAVLDVQQNLVVGIVAESWFPDQFLKDLDTAWAVDGQVISRLISLEKIKGILLQKESLPLRPAPEPKLDKDLLRQVLEAARLAIKERAPVDKYSWNNAPSVLTEWTGRDHLLAQITDDWNDPQKHVTGLIGFGGEGKSSLARKWVDTLLTGDSLPIFSEKKGEGPGMGVDGVFWWGFYENRSVDEFLEAALKYMSGGRIDPRQVQSSNLRAQIIGAMLGTGRYLFVLDGLEVLQHQEGDQYGLLQSNDLRDLLTFFARPDNQSFCLITSRAPLLDLMDYTTYTHRDVDRLSEEDGRALLRRLGVKGSDDELNKVVSDWDGHALTLSILAAYLAERYEGDIHHLADIHLPTADEPRYERVHRVLRRYDEHLTEEEREFLKLFSVFRLPVPESAFEKVFKPLLKSLDQNALLKLVSRLANYRLIRHDEHEKAYTTHPLIRNHYFALFTKGDPSQEKAAHSQIKDYYLSIAGDTPEYPTLDDLKPLIEVVHHTCEAGAHDEAFTGIYWERINQSGRGVIIYQLGAYDTNLSLLLEFFPKGDITQELQVKTANEKSWILNEIGLCLKSLGRLRDAVPFYERSNVNQLTQRDSHNASITYQNLADLHSQLGALEASTEAARHALELARRAEKNRDASLSLAYLGSARHLLGNMEAAKANFLEAEKLEQEQYLYVRVGILHADYLIRAKDFSYARKVTKANLVICERHKWISHMSMCHRVLGDLHSDISNHESARAHYESALTIARGIQRRDVLIEALLARGRWQARHMKDSSATFSDLNEALGYCVESGYRIYEADVRVALGWANLAIGNQQSAKAEAERALQMSNEMGYHWGKVDAEEVLQRIKAEG